AVELLQWDDDTGWRAFETCTPDADGLYQFDPRSFLWWEVDPGTLDDLNRALTDAGLRTRLDHTGTQTLAVILDSGPELLLVTGRGAVLDWSIRGSTHRGSTLTFYERDPADLVEQISQVAHAPAHPGLADLFATYVSLRFACAETGAQVRIEADPDHDARVSAQLPDGSRLDVLHRPATTPGGTEWWWLHDTSTHPAPPVRYVRTAPPNRLSTGVYAAGHAAHLVRRRQQTEQAPKQN
ncbi:MAG: hypothetical protein JWO67_3269, partial [Streptosporangiaceae bacterium]|nr:hypothetical protein [Streptosporangiaceae bacterium]